MACSEESSTSKPVSEEIGALCDSLQSSVKKIEALETENELLRSFFIHHTGASSVKSSETATSSDQVPDDPDMPNRIREVVYKALDLASANWRENAGFVDSLNRIIKGQEYSGNAKQDVGGAEGRLSLIRGVLDMSLKPNFSSSNPKNDVVRAMLTYKRAYAVLFEGMRSAATFLFNLTDDLENGKSNRAVADIIYDVLELRRNMDTSFENAGQLVESATSLEESISGLHEISLPLNASLESSKELEVKDQQIDDMKNTIKQLEEEKSRFQAELNKLKATQKSKPSGIPGLPVSSQQSKLKQKASLSMNGVKAKSAANKEKDKCLRRPSLSHNFRPGAAGQQREEETV